MIVAVTVLLNGCGSGANGEEPATDRPEINDPGPIHVHGLGINPKDGALFIATHTGLFRAAAGEQKAARVGDRYQDTMGFTVVGADRFLGSGHPDGRDGLPPYLGLIESEDAGRRWEPVSLLGKADFHVLEASGSRVYGFGSDFATRRAQFLISTDGGRQWTERDVAAPLVALAIDPDDPDSIVASDGSKLLASTDGGREWRRRRGPGGLLAWTEDGDLAAVTADGAVAGSDDGGQSWQERGRIGGEPAAFESAGRELLAALHDGTIMRSTDGGRSWQVRSQP